MSRKSLILIFSIIVIIFTSCVSKKKFLEMQSGRLRAEEISRQLSDENNKKASRIQMLILDFENMKNELLESNAIKDNYIDSLNSEINILAENINKQKESLQETSFTLDFEKQRLSESLAAKNKILQSLQVKNNDLEMELAAKSSEIEQKNFDLKREADKVAVLEGKIATGEGKIAELRTQLEKVKTEINNLKTEAKEKDATILKLSNNVKLLKNELAK